MRPCGRGVLLNEGIPMDRATVTEFQRADGVRDWRVLDAGASAWFDAPSMAAGAALCRVAGLAAATGLPDVDLRPGGVRVRIGPGGLTRDDVEVARSISVAAWDLGLAADPAVLQTVRLDPHRERFRSSYPGRPGRQRSGHRHVPPGVAELRRGQHRSAGRPERRRDQHRLPQQEQRQRPQIHLGGHPRSGTPSASFPVVSVGGRRGRGV